MLITELLEKLGKFQCIRVMKPHEIWRGYFVIDTTLDEREVKLLQHYIPFESYSFQHFKNGNDNELRFHIDMGKPVKKKRIEN